MTLDTSEKVALSSIAFNVLLVIMKYGLALASGSVALAADAVHSLTDVVSAASVLVGIRLSKRRSRAFPYGLYKIENLVSLGIALLIFVAGFEIAREVFVSDNALHPARVPLAMAGVCVAIVATYFFSRYQLTVGRRLNSPSIIADGAQHRSDMWAYFAILAGLTGAFLRITYFDKGAALLVLVLIVRTGYEILIGSIRVLLDASLDFETLDKVKTLVTSEPQVDAIKGLWGRNSGRYKFIEAVVTLKTRDLEQAHFISEKISDRIKSEIPHVDHILIHYEPRAKETVVFAVPMEKDQHRISEHFGDAPLFYLRSVYYDTKRIKEEHFIANPHTDLSEGKGIKVSEWLIDQGVDKIISRKSFEGKGPQYVFANAMVDVITTDATELKHVDFHAQL